MPCDGGFDHGVEPVIPPLDQDDPRVQRLEEEVRLWTAASHAMYTVWSIVQATDDIVRRIEGWLEDPSSAEEAEKLGSQVLQHKAGQEQNGDGLERPRLRRGKSGETIADNAEEARELANGDGGPELPALGDFDYIGYALERIRMFRQEMVNLGV